MDDVLFSPAKGEVFVKVCQAAAKPLWAKRRKDEFMKILDPLPHSE